MDSFQKWHESNHHDLKKRRQRKRLFKNVVGKNCVMSQKSFGLKRLNGKIETEDPIDKLWQKRKYPLNKILEREKKYLALFFFLHKKHCAFVLFFQVLVPQRM